MIAREPCQFPSASSRATLAAWDSATPSVSRIADKGFDEHGMVPLSSVFEDAAEARRVVAAAVPGCKGFQASRNLA